MIGKIFTFKRAIEEAIPLSIPWIHRYTLKLIVPKRKNAGIERRKFDHHFLSVMYGNSKHGSAMLAIPVIASLTSRSFKIIVEDENIERINFDEQVDLVGITATTALVERAYEIADIFRKKGIIVVMGGIHASSFPEESLKHADVVVVGEAEPVWRDLIRDFKQKKLRKIYVSKKKVNLNIQPLPRYDLVNNRKYSFHNVQTIRGCPNDCGYCSVPWFCGREYRSKSVKRVIREIRILNSMQKKTIYICDDNFTVDVKRVKILLKKLIPLRIKYSIQARLEIYKDTELLELLHNSGCVNIVMGLESVNQSNLSFMNKKGNVDEYHEAVRTIQLHGLLVSGSFMLGQEGDDITVFEKTVKFIRGTTMGNSIINIVTPLPGTAFYYKLEKEGRILHKNWTSYDLKTVCFQPKHMSIKELQDGFRWVHQSVFKLDAIYLRMMNLYKVWNKGGYRLDRRDFLLLINLISHDVAYSYPMAGCPKDSKTNI